MEEFTFALAIGIKLHTERELDNAVDKFAMKQRNSWPFTSRVLANFLVLYRTRRKECLSFISEV